MTRGKDVRPFGEHVGDLVPVYFAEITSLTRTPSKRSSCLASQASSAAMTRTIHERQSSPRLMATIGVTPSSLLAEQEQSNVGPLDARSALTGDFRPERLHDAGLCPAEALVIEKALASVTGRVQNVTALYSFTPQKMRPT